MFGIGFLELIIIVAVLGLVLAAIVTVLVVTMQRSGSTQTDNPNLRPCPDCGRPVSKRAATCPNCGGPVKGG